MRRISRRELLGLGAAAGMVAVSGAPADALPSRGGSLRLGLAGRGIRAFDGRRPFDPIMRVLGHGAVFDCLTEIGADGAISGELATGWRASADARVWTFDLRPDAVFHDGRPFGPDDVVATLKLHMASARRGDMSLAGQIAQVRKAGRRSVQITLVSGNPGLPFLLSDPQFIMLPAHAPEEAMAKGNGTGLYRLEAGASHERAVLKRVESHYKDGRSGWFDRVEVLAIADPSARLEALKLGRVDAVNMADPAWASALRRHGRIALTAVPGETSVLELSVEGGRADEARAIAAALSRHLDREAIRASVLRGRGVVLAGAPSVSGDVNGTAVTLAISSERFPGADALVRDVADAARRAGMVPRTDAALRIVARLRPVRPTEDWALSLARPVQDAEFAGDLALARAALDAGERTRRLRDLSARAAERPVVTLARVPSLIAHSTRLRHGEPLGALWDMDSARIAERWWYA